MSARLCKSSWEQLVKPHNAPTLGPENPKVASGHGLLYTWTADQAHHAAQTPRHGSTFLLTHQYFFAAASIWQGLIPHKKDV